MTVTWTAHRTTVKPTEREVRYFFRTNSASDGWTRIESRAGIEALITGRSVDDPWVTVARVHGDGTYPEGATHSYFQTLFEDPAAVSVSGGIAAADGSDITCWTSWCVGMPRGPIVRVGPRWYSELLWNSSVQTTSDALAQLWPALHLDHHPEDAVRGYLWRPLDLDPGRRGAF